MASNFLHEARRGAGRGSIDLPVAIVAALSIGFVAFMLPSDILARAVETSRLPEFLPAAAPPLGTTARAAIALAAAGAAFAAVYFLLRLLGPKPAEPRERIWPEADTEREPEAPRLRRSDVHPDAPARRPILATRELGEPAPALRREEPQPQPDAPAAPPEEEPLELTGPGIEMLVPEPESPAVAEPAPQPIVAEPVVEPSVSSRPFAGEPAAPVRSPRTVPADPAPQPEEAAPTADASIAELMARLERGLARRARPTAGASAPAAAPAPAHEPAPAAEEWGDERLRSAIENLQRMAARAG